MSLNGLDDAKVKDAHDAAVAEPGGWFLLKYASRDEVELLDRGNGGVVEVRNAIAEYEDKSPLYGFLRYRRRNVIIKYLPDDCSRLVQARVTVHFNSICDRFSPFDTAFSISDAKELKDTKLSAACSLHAASGSTSSSTSSLRRRRLMEIAEEEEDEERDRKRQSIVKEEDQAPPTTDREKKNLGPTSPESPVKLNADLASSPEASKFTDEAEPPHFLGFASPPSPSKSFDDSGRRMSSQSARPDLYSPSSYPYGKLRVKLAPRPSADLTGRPRTSAGAATFRPVSTIPAGLKLTKTPKKGRRDQDDDFLDSPIKEEAETTFPPVPSQSPEPVPAVSEPARPHTSSGAPVQITRMPSFKLAIPPIPPPPSKQNTMTPEKQRLLKAMKLREKKKMMYLQPSPELPDTGSPSSPSTPGIMEQTSETGVSADEREAEDASAEGNNHLGNRRSLTKADSAIGIDVGADQASVDTHSDSHPTSPLATSEIGDSTQASSLSESTDETILAAKESELPPLEPSPIIKEESLTETTREAEADSLDGQLDMSDSDKFESESDEEEGEALYTGNEGENEAITEPAPSERLLTDNVPTVSTLPISKFSAASLSPMRADFDLISAAAEVTTEKENIPSKHEASVEPSVPQTPESPQIRIPVSKFSTQGDKSPTSPGLAAVEVPSIVTNLSDADNDVKAEENIFTADGGADIASDTESVSTKRSKRKTLEIRTDLEVPEIDKRRSVSSLFDDDGLIDELQSATVQQAKPITVSKSTMSPFQPSEPYAKRPATALESGSSTPRIVRTVSNPIRGPLLVPGDVSTSSARTVSSGAAFLHKITQQNSSADLRPKSNKIGSSISQRIKALEKLSSSTGTGESASKDRPAATFFSVRKPSGREPSRSPSVADRGGSLPRGMTPSPPESGESSPESVKRTGAMISRLSMFEGGKPPRGRPESIQVTARIIRDANQRFPKVPDLKADPTEFEPLDLKQSPLLVNVQKRSPSPNPFQAASAVLAPSPLAQDPQPEPKQSLLQRRFSKERRSQSQDRHTEEGTDAENTDFDGPRPRRRSSLTVVKDFIKDRRESLLGVRSPSTDNLGLSISAGFGGLASPAIATPSKSPGGSRPPSVHHNSIFPRRLSIGSRRSSIEQNTSPVALSTTNLASAGLSPPPRTAEGGDSEAEGRSVNGYSDKRSGSASGGSNPTSPTVGKSSNASRATRFMRRLSNSLSSGRKNITPSISPTVAEEEDAEVEAAGMGFPQSRGSTATGATSYLQPTIISYMGDVNVQFPDNLLWKRRTICLDSQGFLILSAVQGATAVPLAVQGKDRHHQAGAVKRYHLSDFRTPYTPEMEVQELPNSVVLDFVDGSGLQVACEDRAGQMNVLHVLQEAHHNHTNFGL